MNKDVSQVGQYLQYEREKQGIPIEEIAGELKLSVTVLKDIEAGNFDKLPEAVYTKGYIRSYCAIIGIDPEPAIKLFLEQTDSRREPLLEEQVLSPLVNDRTQYLTRVWGTILVAAVIIFVLVGRWIEVGVPERTETVTKPQTGVLQGVPNKIITPKEVEIKESEIPATPKATQSTETASETVPNNTAEQSKTVTLTVTAHGSSWARIYTDQEDIVRRMLPSGYNKSFVIEFPIHFELGDARNVRILLNGSRYDLSSYINSLHTAFFSLERLPPTE